MCKDPRNREPEAGLSQLTYICSMTEGGPDPKHPQARSPGCQHAGPERSAAALAPDNQKQGRWASGYPKDNGMCGQVGTV